MMNDEKRQKFSKRSYPFQGMPKMKIKRIPARKKSIKNFDGL